MSKMLNTTTFQECYDNFILQLKIIFTDNETHKILDDIKSMSDEDKIIKGNMFVDSITPELFDDFIKSKIKIFSHKNVNTKKISESLLDSNLCIKNLLNNQPETVKKVIWLKLHILYMSIELLKPEAEQNSVRLKALNKLVNKAESSDLINYEQNNPNNSNNSNNSNNPNNPKNKLKDMLGVDVNDQTTSMIDDIVSSFEKVLSGNANSNPLSGIMEISQKISVKYADKINNGEIELDKLMKSISQKVPGMESMLNGMMGDTSKSGDTNSDGLSSMMSSMMSGMVGGDATKPKEKIIMNDNFSTADVEVGLTKVDDKKSINIGSVLKIADQFGVIPGGKQSNKVSESNTSSGFPDLSGLGGLSGLGSLPGLGDLGDMGNIPHLGKMMEMMNKLGKTETQEDADALKREMDTFLESELGLDVNKLNMELENVINNMSNTSTYQ